MTSFSQPEAKVEEPLLLKDIQKQKAYEGMFFDMYIFIEIKNVNAAKISSGQNKHKKCSAVLSQAQTLQNFICNSRFLYGLKHRVLSLFFNKSFSQLN